MVLRAGKIRTVYYMPGHMAGAADGKHNLLFEVLTELGYKPVLLEPNWVGTTIVDWRAMVREAALRSNPGTYALVGHSFGAMSVLAAAHDLAAMSHLPGAVVCVGLSPFFAECLPIWRLYKEYRESADWQRKLQAFRDVHLYDLRVPPEVPVALVYGEDELPSILDVAARAQHFLRQAVAGSAPGVKHTVASDKIVSIVAAALNPTNGAQVLRRAAAS